METVDQASVQRMCRNAIALQQTLSSITATREVALDNARNFYEMLYMDPEVGFTLKNVQHNLCIFVKLKIFFTNSTFFCEYSFNLFL